jgi:FkbM family methyltransferase
MIQKWVNLITLIFIKLHLKKNYQNWINIIDFDYVVSNFIWKFYIRKKSDDEFIVSNLFEAELEKYFMMEGGIFLDIGSHIGKYSVLIAKKNPNNVVYSFEANTSTYKTLLINAIINDLPNMKPIQIGISDKKWILTFIENPSDTWISRFEDTDTSCISGIRREVETISIDEFILSQNFLNTDVRLIKIDVEWHEYHVFRWMKQLLMDNKNIRIIAEITSSKIEILSFMQTLNYESNEIKEGYYLFESKN